MNDVAGWVAPAATMIAAMMTAANLGARVTGWGFVVFLLASAAWIVVATGTGQQNLLLTNAFLALVNAVGVWRWLGRQARYEDGGKVAEARSRAQGHAPTLHSATAMAGSNLMGANGEPVAEVVDAMLARSTGVLTYLVVREGGVVGVGERLHALAPVDFTASEEGFKTSLTAQDLAARPVLNPTAWPASLDDIGLVS